MNAQVQALDFTSFIFAQGEELKTNSKQVAEAFGKRHDNVLRDIEKTLTQVSDIFGKLNFEETEYVQENNLGIPTSYRMYEMTKDGFMFLVMGFTGKAAAQIKEAYINAFNLMHAKLFQKQPTAKPLPNALSEILSANLTPVKKMVMLTIIDKADQNGQFQMGVLDLAHLCGIAKSTIVETVSSLESLGFLTITRTRHRTGGSLPNIYTIPERFRVVSGGASSTVKDEPKQQALPMTLIPDDMVMISANRYREMEQSSLKLQFDDLKHVVEQCGGKILTKSQVERIKGVLEA
jgi:Rha family phage regulatory protein